jgi:hypothetical protein
MRAGLVRDVVLGLELEGRVLDIEMADEAVLKSVEDLGRGAVREAVLVHDDVRGQRRHVRGDGPGVQVVHAAHLG